MRGPIHQFLSHDHARLDTALARMHAIPPVRAAQHLDEPRIDEHIARMLAAWRGPPC